MPKLPVSLLLAAADYAVLLVEGTENRAFSARGRITLCFERDERGRVAVNVNAARENSCCP
jgi:hypothetical protein